MAKVDFENTDFENMRFDAVDISDENAKLLKIEDINFLNFDINKFLDSDEKDAEKALNNTDASLHKMQERSEGDYRMLAKRIVRTSVNQLRVQNQSKTQLKFIFTHFFVAFIAIQYIAMLLIFAAHMFMNISPLPTEIIIAYISSVFAETIGAIVLMIKYAFDSSQETQVLAILNGVITNYQKFNNGQKYVSSRKTDNRKRKT